MSLARLPVRIAAVLAQRGARVAEGPGAQKTISQNLRAAGATQRLFFFRSGACSSKAVDASPSFVFRGIDREAKLLLQGSGHGAPYGVGLPAGCFNDVTDGGAAGGGAGVLSPETVLFLRAACAPSVQGPRLS